MDFDKVADQVDKDIRDANRPIVETVKNPNDEDVHARIRLRCESIMQMAFLVWVRSMRGEAAFIGPLDVWKFNEMKRLLFSIDVSNGEFDHADQTKG